MSFATNIKIKSFDQIKIKISICAVILYFQKLKLF